MLVRAFIDSSDSLAKRCIERAAGNPLFLEQLLLGVEQNTSENLPDSSKSRVLARMDQLLGGGGCRGSFGRGKLRFPRSTEVAPPNPESGCSIPSIRPPLPQGCDLSRNEGTEPLRVEGKRALRALGRTAQSTPLPPPLASAPDCAQERGHEPPDSGPFPVRRTCEWPRRGRSPSAGRHLR